LERIAAVLQGKHDNYDIDLMRSLILASAEASDTPADGERAVSHRVIADHLRTSSFLIADGVLPANEGRGYVLRRIMRRAMRHAHMLGCREPLMHRLVPALISAMGQHYGELGRAEALITETLKLEETRFKETLGRGLRLLEEETASLGEGSALPGEVAFRLYDTYGFPLDLTQDILRGQGRSVDTDGYDSAMERQRAAARQAWAGSGEAATEAVWFELREKLGATEFLGYETESAEGVITGIVVDGKPVEQANAGEDAMIIANQTPFYGESGGQMGDQGSLFSAEGGEFAVSDTLKRLETMHVHVGAVTHGTLKVGDAVEMRVDGERRQKLRANHSVTHLMHEALRRVLGDHVTQKGSLVAPDYMRFDFSHPKPVTAEEIAAVERDVNRRIRTNGAVLTRLMSPDDAVEAGALALFGEKYGEEVRVVSMGIEDGPVAEGEPETFFSTELCGGTHVARTGDIGFFMITAESAVAAGVRRIEAVTGDAAFDYVVGRDEVLSETATALRVAPGDVPGRVSALLDERRKLEREVSDLRQKLAAGGGGTAAAPEARNVGGVSLATRKLDGVPAKELKPLVDTLKQQIKSGVVAVVAVNDGKASLVVGVTGDLTERFDAVQLVRAGSAAIGGKGGGGRPDMAQAGGPDGAAADAALSAIEAAMDAA
ncbi:MAG: alanine--tRNA ligase, partial [Pseudomonadota bacterium]